ncbi:MAG: GNAT family N-acetyltransferase [Rickettsiales bacterium]|jgi:RimJ/RimL family protein N-acetyltransferase|nr:GNAT family N-acetyltransferase [Rickettsiales bacterium]
MPKIIYKKLNPADLQQLVHIERIIIDNMKNKDWITGRTEQEYAQLIDLGNILGAFDDNKLVGFGRIQQDEDNESIYKINGGFVLPEYRNNGIQTELVKLRIGLARDRGAKKATTQCHPDNLASRRAIEKSGFIFTGIKPLPNGSPRAKFEIDLLNE